MTDAEIARRLADLEAVYTPTRRVRNDIIEITDHSIVVCSELTDVHREIPFSAIRNAENVTTNGVIVRALRAALDAGSGQDGSKPVACWAPAAPSPKTSPQAVLMVAWYGRAKAWVGENTDWVDTVRWNRDPASLTDAEFLAEYAWAVYVSGFRAGTVSVKWTAISRAWRGFDAERIDAAARLQALNLIAHRSKTQAILRVAGMVRSMGWPAFRLRYLLDPESIGQLPWMGPANRRFLARNLRLADVGKPDRWLVRFAEAFGYRDVDTALAVIQKEVGDNAGLADAYIWAFLSEKPGALDE